MHACIRTKTHVHLSPEPSEAPHLIGLNPGSKSTPAQSRDEMMVLKNNRSGFWGLGVQGTSVFRVFGFRA